MKSATIRETCSLWCDTRQQWTNRNSNKKIYQPQLRPGLTQWTDCSSLSQNSVCLYRASACTAWCRFASSVRPSVRQSNAGTVLRMNITHRPFLTIWQGFHSSFISRYKIPMETPLAGR